MRRFFHQSGVRKIAINRRPSRQPWGGGNQWVVQMKRWLTYCGFSVTYTLDSKVDCIILSDPRVGGMVTFGIDEIVAFRKVHPSAACIHRVNECDARKGTDFMDRLLQEANRVADMTVFISDWLKKYHVEKWFDPEKPHTVIYNGADGSIFHPRGSALFGSNDPLRIITHHWSDNWNKGFRVYREIDELISSGVITDTELWVVGRWPQEIVWKAARTFPPVCGRRLADIIRKCHLYCTASLYEPGGMHHVEAAQCGLPVIYHEDGGGIVEQARKYGIPFNDTSVKDAVLAARRDYARLKRKVLACIPSGERMCIAYTDVIKKVIAEKEMSK